MSKAGCCGWERINRFLNTWCWLASKEMLFLGKGSKTFLNEGGQTQKEAEDCCGNGARDELCIFALGTRLPGQLLLRQQGLC